MQRTNSEPPRLYGIAARYGTEAAFLQAIHATVAAGYRRLETYSPFAIKGLYAVLGLKKTRIQWVVFFGGLFGGLGGFLMQYIANVSAYPLNIGGRPFNSWPAFIPISFELTVLFAAFSGFIAFLLSCRLPEVSHPIFAVPGFEHASADGFFLCIKADDEKFSADGTRLFLEGTHPEEVHRVDR